ncbi:MAG: hypothetical protein FJY75_13840, partial [Candidatus Eisenbacteria bacterium]|nr:hypothetical protein [Candidatus Eisenbacteria bacterium]
MTATRARRTAIWLLGGLALALLGPPPAEAVDPGGGTLISLDADRAPIN